MSFRVKEEELQEMLSNRDSVSHYKISRDWFLGFVEAEGCFLGKGNSSPIFEISQHSSDLFLFLAIKKWIGEGRVRLNKRQDGRCTVVYTLSGKDKIRSYLLLIFEGCLPRNPKIERSFLPWCNTYFPDKQLKERCSISNFSQDFVAGFVDGDGSFYVTTRKQQDYKIGFQL